MKQIEWVLLIIPIMYDGWKRLELFFLREIGWPYEKIEEEGIISPVTSISCDYKATSTFADEISIEIIVKSVKSARLLCIPYGKSEWCSCLYSCFWNIVSCLRMVVLLILKEIIPHFFNLLKEHSVMQ